MNTLLRTSITEEDQQAFNRLAADFAGNELADLVHEYEYPYTLDSSMVIQKITDLGFLSLNLPSEFGGLGLASHTLAGILEQVSRIDAGLAGTLFANAAALELLAAASDVSNCEKMYEAISQPGALPLAFQAYASPQEASVPLSVKDGECYRLHGTADLLVSGDGAYLAVIPAKNQEGRYSYYLVNLEDGSLMKSGPVLTIGMQSCRPVDVELKGVPALLIGKEGEGNDLFDVLCRRMSCPLCGIFLGIMKGALSEALEYCGQRYQGGRMIIEWGDIRMKLAGMKSLVAMAEACLHGLESMLVQGRPDAGTAALASAVHVGTMALSVTSEGMQALGGNGYMKDYGQEKRLRDVKQAQCLLGSQHLRKIGILDRLVLERQDTGR